MAAMDRRTFLRTGIVAGGGAALLGGPAPAAPALVRSGRPALTHGVQSGDVTARSAVVWARADRPARMFVEVSTRPDFARARTLRGPVLTPATDLTGKALLRGLLADEPVHYRVRLADLDDASLLSAPVTGRFRTAPARHRDVRFVWSGDLAGQGWGINPDIGGFRIFRAMAALDPDFFLCSGDLVYADGPLTETVTLPGGRTWRNIVTPEKTKVAETLAEFRGQFRYNLLDANLRAFNATVPMVYQWDDHETRNNWYPGQVIDDARYTEKDIDALAARARRAVHEYTPITPRDTIYRKISHGPLLDVFVLDMRTFKDPNGPNNSPTAAEGLLGVAQTAWLKRELAASRATWKVIANDLPLGLVVPDGANFEAAAQGDGGLPLGREREIAEVLAHIKHRRVTGTVWLTADVHYTSAHFYDPTKAIFQDFEPFWEFVTGPLNAGAFGPNALDGTFGPQVRFQRTPPAANTSPADGFQFFGEVDIDGRTAALTVRLRDLDGAVLFTAELPPAH